MMQSALIRPMNRSNLSLPSSSRFIVGSSRIKAGGLLAAAAASLRRCTVPEEQCRTWRCRYSSNPNASMRSSADRDLFPRDAKVRFSMTVSSGYGFTRGPVYPAHGSADRIMSPRRCFTEPSVGESKQARIRSRVDFPDPFGPVTQRDSPVLSSRSMFRNRNLLLNLFPMPCARIV